MPNRDVNLIIKARDQASASIRRINESIRTFINEQRQLGSAAESSGSSLQQLTAAAARLRSTFGDQNFSQQVTQEVAKAERAYESLRRAQKEAFTGAGASARAANRQAATLQSLQVALDKVTQQYRQEQARLKSLTDTRDQANNRLKASRTEYTRVSEELQRSIKDTAASQDRLVKNNQELETSERRLASITNQTTAGYQKQLGVVERRRATLEKTSVALTRQRAETAALRQVLPQLNLSLGVQAVELERIEQAYKATEQRVGALGTEVKESTATFSLAEKNLQRLRTEAKNFARDLSASNSRLRESSDALAETRANAGRFEKSLRVAGAAVRGSFLNALREQRQRVEELQLELREAGQNAARYGRALSQTTMPSQQLVTNFQRARDASRLLKAELRSQLGTFQNMQAVLRRSGNDLQALAANQGQFVSSFQRGQTSLDNYRRSVAQLRRNLLPLSEIQERTRKSINQTTPAVNRLSNAYRRKAANINTVSGALRDYHNRNRDFFNLMGRVRDRLALLVATYIGFFGVFRGLGRIVETFETIEAAQVRLSAALGGDNERLASTFARLERLAGRLGIQFGVLATEYTAFATAARGTRLEGEASERLFRQVAEAARVQNLSVDQFRGVFVALQQIVSKGTVSMEELRQQLGDRIPGAVPIFAESIGVSVEELFKLVEAGQVGAEELIKFGDELERRFGPSLEQSLNNISAAVGRFQNQAFLAFARIGEAGAIESLRDLFNDLSQTLGSPDFGRFLDALGRSAAVLVDAIAALARNFDILIQLLLTSVFISFQRIIRALLAQLLRYPAVLRRLRIRFSSLRREVNSTVTSFGRLTFGLRALRTVLLSFTGGLVISAILGGIGYLLGRSITQADDLTESLHEVGDELDRIRSIADRTGGDVDSFLSQLADEVSQVEIEAQLREAEAALQDIRKEIEADLEPGWFEGTMRPIQTFRNGLRLLLDDLVGGRINMQEFNREVDRLGELTLEGLSGDELADTEERMQDLILAFAAHNEELTTGISNVENLNDLYILFTGTIEEQAAALDRLREARVKDGEEAQRQSIREAQSLGRQADQIAAQREAFQQRLFTQLDTGATDSDIAATRRQLESLSQLAIDTNVQAIEALNRALAGIGESNYCLLYTSPSPRDS